MENEQFLWCEKYRPRTIEDCILPSSLKETFLGVIQKGELQNFLFSGSSGTGKTTVARALCDELGCDVLFLNGSLGADESGIEAFRTRVRQFAACVSFCNKRKIVIIDESDYLNPNSSQPALRGLIEEFSENCGFIFTCNFKNKIIEAIHSRCSVVEFRIPKEEKAKIASEFVKRVLYILEQEKVKVDDKKIIVDFVMKYFPDFRRILNELQRFAVAYGEINVGLLSKQSETNLNISLLMKALKEKDYKKTREWVVSVLDNEPSRIFRKIYDSLSENLKPQSIPEVVVLIGHYQYQSAFSIDQEVNLLAFLVELMVLEAVE